MLAPFTNISSTKCAFFDWKLKTDMSAVYVYAQTKPQANTLRHLKCRLRIKIINERIFRARICMQIIRGCLVFIRSVELRNVFLLYLRTCFSIVKIIPLCL